MIVLIDNYDSFTFNLKHAFEELGRNVLVIKNDEIDKHLLQEIPVSHLVIGPGPGAPEEVLICKELILEFGPKIPTLGVCLGHQCIAECFGGKVIRAQMPMHGKTSTIMHSGEGIFEGVNNPMIVGRYHSLIVEKSSLPSCLVIMAMTENKEIMAMQHAIYPIVGVQFHPESILSTQGIQVLHNFLSNKNSR